MDIHPSLPPSVCLSVIFTAADDDAANYRESLKTGNIVVWQQSRRWRRRSSSTTSIPFRALNPEKTPHMNNIIIQSTTTGGVIQQYRRARQSTS